MYRLLLPFVLAGWGAMVLGFSSAAAQPAPMEEASALREALQQLERDLDALDRAAADPKSRQDVRQIVDVRVCAKAVEWILRHEEFYKPKYVEQARAVVELGQRRADRLLKGDKADWLDQPGATVLGYVSRIDESVQPYIVTRPAQAEPPKSGRWPLHVVLHGRAMEMNEVDFITRHEGKPSVEGQDWIQIDVYGRSNNAYRWAGETDVFEALADVKRCARIDEHRITLHGFSMGGAGAWHLGLHHPSRWSSVGAGAGFVDTYEFLKIAEPLPKYQHKTLKIYDAEAYALNAADVPIVTYGGEQDAQLVASTTMVKATKEQGVDIEMILGKEAGHKFTPEGWEQFMGFLRKHSETGRPPFPGPKHVDFVTYTPKYNRCEWLTIEEMPQHYQPAIVRARLDAEGTLHVTTENVNVLQLSRDIAEQTDIDGDVLPLNQAADGLLPGVYYELSRTGWRVLDYDESRRFTDNLEGHKRHDLQGPIDDAFMQPFVCVLPSGEPWSAEQAAWADWTYQRFAKEWDKWLRGRVRSVKDTEVTAKLTADANLILFGDPGSNAVLAEIADRLPIKWTREGIEVAGKTYDPSTHGVALIFPNPLNPSRYVVINSGHSFHEEQFRGSNATLYPRLGDIAVQKFERNGETGYTETVEWATLFNSQWQLPAETK